jgi:cytochrome c oxidase assembly protein subunit 15
MKKNFNGRVTRLKTLSVVTLVSLYLLILAGGIVRSTGSGMGCPDWPKCFGKIIPPTTADQLPEDYKEQFAEFRYKKNVRFAGLLRNIGFDDLANHILEDPSILIESDFNAAKTWIEYINRLIGAFTGLLIMGLLYLSVTLWKHNSVYAIVAGITVLMTAFQGWLGSIVVSTNLLSGLVSLHMFIAFVIVGLVLFLHQKINFDGIKMAKRFPYLGMIVFCIFLLIVQVFFGVEVREMLDSVARQMNYEGRGEWLKIVGEQFYLHRSFSLFVLAFNFFTVWKIWTTGWMNERAKKIGISLIALIVLEAMSGATMAYFAIPAFVQPIHLLLAVLIFSAQFILLLHFTVNKKVQILAVN